MREHWGSRLGFILASAGSAIGLGTLWKFPYVTANNGGGIFLFFYLFFICFLGIPLFVGELILGRRGQRGAVGIFARLKGENSPWKTLGWIEVFAAFLILSYYCVIAGWGVSYLIMSLNQYYEIHSIQDISKTFTLLFRSGDISFFWAFIFMLITLGVILRGVRQGIEFWNRILMTLLICLLGFLCIYAINLEGFKQSMQFLFVPNVSNFTPCSILEALGLAFFTLSLSQGVILTYGSYVTAGEDLPKTAMIIGMMVVGISILTLFAIFPVIFTFDLPLQEGMGLIFKTLPLIFLKLPGSTLLSAVFFALFTFAALTSSVALLEVLVANFIDLFQWSRKKATLCSAAAVLVVCIPSAVAGAGDLFHNWLPIYGKNFLETMDALVSIWVLPVGGFLTAIFLGWVGDKHIFQEEFCSGTRLSFLFPLWFFVIRWLAPVAMLFIFLQKGGFIKL